jgi:hypothetical protein
MRSLVDHTVLDAWMSVRDGTDTKEPGRGRQLQHHPAPRS